MGYRRRRQTKSDDGLLPDLFDGLLDLAKAVPIAGIIVGGVLCIGAVVIRAQGAKAFFGMGGVLALLCFFASIPFFLVGIAGLIKIALASTFRAPKAWGPSADPIRRFQSPVPFVQNRNVPISVVSPRSHPSPASVPVAGPGAATSPPLPPYRRETHLLSNGELAFYDVLRYVVGNEYQIQVKVRLLDLLHLPAETPQRSRWVGRAAKMHVDFVLCAPANLEPLLVIELDDKSHFLAWRKQRDRFVNDALKSAGVNFLRVRCQFAYDVEGLRGSIKNAIEG